MTMVPLWMASSADPVSGRLSAFRAVGPDSAAARAPAAPPIGQAPSARPLLVEAHEASGVVPLRGEWEDLVGRCLEPNVFLEPDFCLSVAQHLPPACRPIFLLVWALGPDGNRTLVAVCPLVRPGWSARGLAASWFHELSALSGPLLDRDQAGPALQALLGWIAGRYPACRAWLIPALAAEGATAQAIATVAGQTARPLSRLDPRRRAVLRQAEPAGLDAVSRKKAKDLRRQHRGLAAQGTLGYATARSGEELRDALERFLLLESQGWKGRRGTALLRRPEQAAFVRAMTRLMARHGQCRIESLTLDGRPIAMGIVLSSGGRDFFWKMAYDEAYASASPGVLFVIALTERQQQARDVEMTDSCAMPDHPMIDHLWRGRLDLVDMLIAVPPGPAPLFHAVVGLERLRRRVRAALKHGRQSVQAALARRGAGGRPPS